MNNIKEELNKQIEELQESINQLDRECDNFYLQQQRCDFEKDYTNDYLKTKKSFKKNKCLASFSAILGLLSLISFFGEVCLGGQLLYILSSLFNIVLSSIYGIQKVFMAVNNKKHMDQFHSNFPDLLDENINDKLIEIDINREKICCQVAENLKKSAQLESRLSAAYNQLEDFEKQNSLLKTIPFNGAQFSDDYFNDFINEKIDYSGVHFNQKIGNQMQYTEDSIKKLRKTI